VVAFLVRGKLQYVKKIVIKVGSNLNINKNRANIKFINSLAKQVSKLVCENREIVIVASGAVGLGKSFGDIYGSDDALSKQAYASIGQCNLISNYMLCFQNKGLQVAQLLITHKDLTYRKTSLKRIIEKLSERKIIPIINQNDSIAAEELSRDNDSLSAGIAGILRADVLILLSEIEGFYRDIKAKEIIPAIKKIDSEIMGYVKEEMSGFGRGGMLSKIRAASHASLTETSTIIACGNIENILLKIFAGEDIGTLIHLNGGD